MTGQQLELEIQPCYWFNPEFISLPSYKLYRAFVRDEWRIYYTHSNELNFFLGVTSATKLYYPKEEQFMEWYRNHQNPKQYVKERAEIGSAEHILIPLFLKSGDITYQYVEQYVDAMINSGYAVPTNFSEEEPQKKNGTLKSLSHRKTTDEIYKALLSFAQFLVDYKVQPIACEIGLKSDRGVGTYIDFICKMTIEEKGYFGDIYKNGSKDNAKGSPKESKRDKEIIALIDFKSGTWDGDEHDGQLWLNKIIWEENYPDLKIEKLYNWHPKDFKAAPTYQLLEKQFNEAESELIIKKATIKKEKMVAQERVSEFDQIIYAGQAPRSLKYLSLKEQILQLHSQQFSVVPQEGETA